MNQYEENSTNSGRLMLPLCNRIITSEINNDYTLPDYQPEIRRVICVTENILPPAKYVSSDSVELNGNIDYTLLYVGADGELYSAPLTSEYSVNAPLSNCPELDRNQAMTVVSSIDADGITARVTAPRKLSLRMRMNCHIRVFGKAVFEESIEGDVDPMSIQRLRMDGEYSEITSGVSDIIEVNDELVAEDCLRVVSADGEIAIGETLSEADGVAVRGDVLLKLLCFDESTGDYSTQLRKIPFSEKVETDRESGSAEMRRARGVISDISVNVEEGKILSRIGFFLDVEEASNLPFSYTSDLYSTEKKCTCQYEIELIPVAIKGMNANISQSERLPVAEFNIPDGAEIIDSYGRAAINNVSLDGGKCVMTGESKYQLVGKKDGEIFSSEIKLPFRYESDVNGCLESERENADILCRVLNCRCRIDGETLCVDSEIALSGMMIGNNEIRRVASASMGEDIGRRGSEVIICYPSVNESVWNVAKKYLVAPKDVIGNPETDRYCIVQM